MSIPARQKLQSEDFHYPTKFEKVSSLQIYKLLYIYKKKRIVPVPRPYSTGTETL